MRKSVAYLDIRKLRLICAEQVIPDHQNAAKILVDVLGIAGVVDAVGRWRIDDPLQPPDPLDQFGVNEELVGQAG